MMNDASNTRGRLGYILPVKRMASQVSRRISDLEDSRVALDEMIRNLTTVREWLTERQEVLRKRNNEIGEAMLYDNDLSLHQCYKKVTSLQGNVNSLRKYTDEIGEMNRSIREGCLGDICKDTKKDKQLKKRYLQGLEEVIKKIAKLS